MKNVFKPAILALLIVPCSWSVSAQVKTLSSWLTAESDMPTSVAPSDLVKDTGASVAGPSLDSILDVEFMDLNRAVKVAVNRHPVVTDAISQLSAASEGVAIAKARYYPQVSMGLGAADTTQVSSSNTASISVSQMLYDFGKTAGEVDGAEATTRQQQAQVLKQIDSIALQTAQAIIDVHRYRTLLDISQEQVKAVEDIHGMTLQRAQAGVTSHSDPIQAQARVDSARSNMLEVRSLYMRAQERLRTLIGGSVDGSRVVLPDSKTIDLSLEGRFNAGAIPDVLMAEAARQVAEARVDVAKANRWPTISLEASSTKAFHGKNPTTYEPYDSDHAVRLNVDAAVYQGGAMQAQVRAAYNELEAARQRIADAKLNASDKLRNYRELALGYSSRLDVMAMRKQSLDEARRLYREQYPLGTRSILDLLNTEQEYYQSLADEEAVSHDLWQALVGFIDAEGRSREFYGLNNTTVQGMEVLP